MNWKLRMGVWLLVILMLSGVLTYVSDFGIQKRNIEKSLQMDVDHIQLIFDGLIERDTVAFLSALEVITNDANIKDIYLEGDRDKLYDYIYPLYLNLNQKFQITHWYFILPDGHTFLREHNKDMYGDKITRFTFWKAENTLEAASGIELGKTASGIELGKTAYALRTVVPYYGDSGLIGYVELGEEIDHFLDILRGRTGGDFLLVAKKEFLDEEKWASVRNVAGLENNWDDLENNVIVASTYEYGGVEDCASENNLLELEKGKRAFQEIEVEGKTHRCVGIPLIDAGDRYAGAVMTTIDISEYIKRASNANAIVFVFSISLFCLVILIGYLIFPFMDKRGKKRK